MTIENKFKVKLFRYDYTYNICIMLFMPIVAEFISIVLKRGGASQTGTVTALIYLVTSFTIICTRKKIKRKSITLICTIFFVFATSWLMFPATREYYSSNAMIQNYIFYIPISVISIFEINGWDDFFKKLRVFSIFALLISGIGLIFLDYRKYIGYMEYSYNILPFICCMYLCTRKSIESKVANLVFTFIGMVELFSFGARAPILFFIIFIIIYEVFGSKNEKKSLLMIVSTITVLLVIFCAYLNLDNIIRILTKFEIFSSSRFIKYFNKNELLVSHGRNILYETCKLRIMSMGLEVSGFFGDRMYCSYINEPYPHNIVYEMLMQHGWIISVILFTCFIVNSVRIVKEKSIVRDIYLYFFIAIFARYFISGSYVQEGRFWIFLSIVINLVLRTTKRIPHRKEYVKTQTSFVP